MNDGRFDAFRFVKVGHQKNCVNATLIQTILRF
jgi:hypothetical protein